MKYLILLILSFNVLAGNYMTREDFLAKKSIVYSDKKECKKHSLSKKCKKINKDFKFDTFKEVDEEIDDYTKPVNSKTEIQPCVAIINDPATASIDESKTAQQVCEALNSSKVCSSIQERVVMAQDFSEIYCTKVLRYNKKLSGRKILVEDAVLKANYEAKKLAEENYKKAVDKELSDMKFGQKLYAMVKVLNKQKGLSKAQRKGLKSTLKTIKDSMFDGDLCEARSEISAIVPDGTLISSSDITLILSKMDAYKTCL